MVSLKNKTVTGVLWNFSELILRRGVAIFTTLVLSWFLSPEAFGLLAMITVFLAFSDVLIDAGFSQALIRKESVTQRELSTAFYANTAIAVLAYAILFFCAPYIALFFEQAELESLIRVGGIAILFNALAVVQQAILNRELMFKLQLQVTLPAALFSGLIAIFCAFSGFGVWALIAQVTSQSLLTTLLYWRLRLWRPSFEFGYREFKELFSFGGYLLLAQATRVPFKNMYVIVIAKVYASTIAGLYFFAEKIRDLVLNQLVNSVQKVTYPALS
ncbi:lipopolysaccharide biosynthesis protein, partial [Methylophaga thiooxydans]|uniref:lipopolysaccharide biosynthesis protein n=1 Tax=Methylophaga thiooxydans TaxID=392484 RepID=UPI00235503EF